MGVHDRVETVNVPRYVDKIIEIEKIVEKPVYVENVVEVPVDRIVPRQVEVRVDKYVEVPVERYVDNVIEVEKVIEKPVWVEIVKEIETEHIVRNTHQNDQLRAHFREVKNRLEGLQHENHTLTHTITDMELRIRKFNEENSMQSKYESEFQELRHRYE